MEGIATKWTRETPWRQGHVLPPNAVELLGLLPAHFSELVCVIVITHDCDLANHDPQVEPDVEVIVGCHPVKADGNCFWAKGPRKLHLDAFRDGLPVIIELVATAKRIVSKQSLSAFEPDPAYMLPGTSLSTLRAWLAVRYNRAAFPDPFVGRLSKAKADKGLAKLVEPLGQFLSAVYFDVDKGREVDRSDGSAYQLKIVLTYPAGDDPERTADQMDALAESIDALFQRRYFDNGFRGWKDIALMACMAISEDDLTVNKARLMKQWRLEHMTLKAEDAG